MRKMPRLRVLLGSLLLVAALLTLAVVPATAQTYFSPFRGDVTVGGVDAPASTVVEAYIDGVLRDTVPLVITTVDGRYSLAIAGGPADIGKAVTFKVDGVTAVPTPASPVFGLVAQDVDLVAGGVPGETYTLTMMAVSPEGVGTTTPAIGPHVYAAGTDVQLTAKLAVVGSQFDHWIINGVSVTENPTTVTMDVDTTATAYFVPFVPPGEYPVLSWWLTTL